MATCKDCIHYEACHDMYYEEHATRHFDPEKPNAEKECGYFKDRSRFVELPCKVGDTVYAYWDMCNSFSNVPHTIENFIVDVVIIADEENDFVGFRARRIGEEDGCAYDIEFDLSDIGKTVFLSREEAEQALKERENDE